jgi:sortase A
VIPKIAVDAPVVETPPQDGVWPVPDWAVGHLTTTPNPGAAGNDALSAHDDIKGELFKRIGELRPGDVVRLFTQHAVYTYIVTSQQTVDPYDTSVLDSTQQATVTLISCTPYWVDTQRIVVQAVLKSQAAA